MNKRYFILFFGLFFILDNLNSQISSTLLDSLSMDIIPYATIWVEDEDNSTMTNEEGFFALKNIQGRRTLVISAAGYITKKQSTELISDTIKLAPQLIELDESTVIGKKRKRNLKVDNIQFSKLGYYLPGFKEQWSFATYFEYLPKYRKTPFLKEIHIATHSDLDEQKFILKLYETSDKGEPQGYLYPDNIIVSARKGKRITKISLQELKISIPREGFFVAVEWIPFQKNVRMWNSIKPEIGFMQLNSDKDSWYYRYGRWRPIWKLTEIDKYKDKYNHLAIELILSN